MRMLLAAVVMLASVTTALAQYGSRSHGAGSYGWPDDGYGSSAFPLGRYVSPHYNSHGEYVGGHFSPDSNSLHQESPRPRGIFGPSMRTYGTRPFRY